MSDQPTNPPPGTPGTPGPPDSPGTPDTPDTPDTPHLPLGRIDIHSHLLPGVDDGCVDVQESLDCIRTLLELGYVGSICTPHIYPELFPQNTLAQIQIWTQQLQDQLKEHHLDYQLWSGGEIRIVPGITQWLENHGTPTLAGSQYVLTDMWEDQWEDWMLESYQWLIKHGYKPILAHPERMPRTDDIEQGIAMLIEMGVLLQGNFRCFTGEDGFHADQHVRKYLDGGQYTFLALDTHRPESMDGRVDGIQIVVDQYGLETLNQMTLIAPRKLIFGIAPGIAPQAINVAEDKRNSPYYR